MALNKLVDREAEFAPEADNEDPEGNGRRQGF